MHIEREIPHPHKCSQQVHRESETARIGTALLLQGLASGIFLS